MTDANGSRHSPYRDVLLADGAVLTATQQALFRGLGEHAHIWGCTRAHQDGLDHGREVHRPGDPTANVLALEAGLEQLCDELPPHTETLKRAVLDYVNLAERHIEVELCHYCSGTELAAVSPLFEKSGLSADLARLLARQAS
ncbi:hypothetical protein ACNKF0_09470 [Nocardioides sp. T5]|uniref:hypothetical protein n=1 Tax=Nocardioides sp. T5 TaxID=3400182 RepID=UPI003A885051